MNQEKMSALKNGVILGVVAIIITQVAYMIDVSLLVDWKLSITFIILSIGIASYMGRKFRDDNLEGFMTFGKAYVYSFIAMLTSYLVLVLFHILLYTVIDPELPEMIVSQTIENTEEMMRNFGTPDEAIDEAIEKMEDDMPANFTSVGLLKGFWVYIIFAAGFSLIAGAIIYKKKPDFETE